MMYARLCRTYKATTYIFGYVLILFSAIFSIDLVIARELQGFQASGNRVLIIVIDGLRPDYVTDETMPTLAGIKQQGFDGQNHHAVYPTSTRINSASIATGSYPQKHGLLNNSLYLPEVSRERKLDTGNLDDLKLIEKRKNGSLLTTTSLGEILGQHSKKLFISSSGSSGSAYLLTSRSENCMLVHRQLVFPDSLAMVVERRIGPSPDEEQHPREKRIRWSVDALLKIGVDRMNADALIIWITEPDGSAHSEGIGSRLSQEALRVVDKEIAYMLKGLDERNLREKTNILYISDHGFSTRTGDQSLTSLLIEKGLKADKSSTDVVIANDAIYVNKEKKELIPQIVHVLQQTTWIGPVFTQAIKSQSMQGWVPGTLSFASVMWDHQRSADILTSGNWTNDTNQYGFRGVVRLPGTAGHNSTSPYDIHATFFASGPDIKAQTKSSVASGNVDIAPTVLYLLGVDVPAEMDGRIIREALKTGPFPSAVPVKSKKYIAETTVDDTHYQTVLYKSFVDGTAYLDSTVTTRD